MWDDRLTILLLFIGACVLIARAYLRRIPRNYKLNRDRERQLQQERYREFEANQQRWPYDSL